MNENLNLVEILKDCPKGTELYSTIFGEVTFNKIEEDQGYPITFTIKNREDIISVASDGRHLLDFDGDCTIFPSKEQRDWSQFKVKSNKSKFDPKTLKPFDKVLQCANKFWLCDFYSHHKDNTPYDDYVSFSYVCVSTNTNRVIPYNEETKHLIGTNKEAPEFYRYWED